MIHSPPEFSYPRGVTHRIATCLAALPVLAGIYYLRERLEPRVAWTLAGVTALACLVFWYWEAGKVVEIHPEGLVLRSAGSGRAVLWESVREVRYRAARTQAGGVFGLLLQALLRRVAGAGGPVDERSVSIRCILLDDQDRRFIITSAWKGAGEAVARILEKVTPLLLREAMGRLRSVGQVDFGPVVVTADAIARGKKAVRFPELSACGLDAGRFFVKKQGAWLTAIQVPVWKIPNVFVLLELLGRLEVPGLRGADLPSATDGR